MFIFIDLDDTILDFKRAEAVALRRTLEHYGIEPTFERIELYSQINMSMWKRLEKKENTREEILVMRFEKFLAEVKAEGDAAEMNEKYKGFLSEGHYFIDGAPEMLEALYSRHHRLFIVSNGTTNVQVGRIASAGIEKYFEGIFLSQDIGFDKPDKRFFERCFERISGFDKAQAIIFGDSESSDICGGRSVEMRTCLFQPKGDEPTAADYRVTALSDFVRLIDEIC